MIALGIDVGGSKIAAGLVTFPDGQVKTSRIIPTLPARGEAAVLADLDHLVSELMIEASTAPIGLEAIGVGVPELVDRSGNIVSSSCLGWNGAAMRERFSRIAPTVIEADVRASARAEAMFGAGRGLKTFLYVSIGTGISSCLVIDGEPFVGARGATGTMASGPLPGMAETPAPALSPTLEQLASGPGLVSQFNQLGGHARTGQDVLARLAEGDATAGRVVQLAAQTIGGSIGWLVNVLDPERVIIGGGLGLAEGLYRDILIDSARRHIWWDGHRDLRIVSAQTGINAGLIGAAANAWKSLCEQE